MITLATLPQATEQEVFDQIATHLLTQERASISGGACAYRGDNGLKCAAGCLISDDEYKALPLRLSDQYTNRATWRRLIEKKIAPPEHANLICDLQGLHDGFAEDTWHKKLIDYALGRDLNTSFVKKFKKDIDSSVESV
jgi:hypothetical protein